MKYQELYKILEENIEKKRNILATVIQGPGQGTKLFFSEGELLAKSSEESFEPEELQRLSETEESGIREVGSRSFFVELLRKPSRLVICGGGHVAQQVILLAKRIGFHVTVLEDRPLFADQARKADADLVVCDDFASGLEKIPGSTDTYFLVVTRGHRYDDICLTSILRKERAYAGMMASRKRGILLKKRLIEEGIPEQEVELLHTPVGLSIHAETPEEIAVSIIAELIMEKNSVKKTSGYEKELLECLTEERERSPRTEKSSCYHCIQKRFRPQGNRNKDDRPSGWKDRRYDRRRLHGKPCSASLSSYAEGRRSRGTPGI